VNSKAFVIQLITFLLAFLLLRKFAFSPVVRLLDQRRKIIEDGVKLGEKMEKEQAKLAEVTAQIIRDARTEADKIIGDGNKEAREIIREAETAGKRKVDAMMNDAEARIEEESKQAKRRLEKEIVGLVSEATEAIVEEKIDPKKDADLIDKALKGRKK
jgi:F-type H+-transporting ATPase subunit b